MTSSALSERSSGVLLHVTSLPGSRGSGDLGPQASSFIDQLSRAAQRFWQILPLGVPAGGRSPYQTLSAFAGDPMLIAFEPLAARGWLDADALPPPFTGPADHADFEEPLRNATLRHAFDRFDAAPQPREFVEFQHRAAFWLPDYTLFRALKDAHGGAAWTSWPRELRQRHPDALARARRELATEVRYRAFEQFAFDLQWTALRDHAAARGIALLADIPIFVSHDSADVWANQREFFLDDEGACTVVAGVPPDYFSATGQRWGNALYRWDVMAENGYAWWMERLRWTLSLTSAARIDHFIGFHRYWEIPADEPTAVKGRYVDGPRERFFERAREVLSALPFVAEDLGVVTPEVTALRERFEMPGMRIVQFSFDGDVLPHAYAPLTVAYTGTHDNDTSRGWYDGLPEHQRARVRDYVRSDGSEIHWDLVRAALESPSRIAIVPAQDLLGLGSSARMNTPGTTEHNWRWRMRPDALSTATLDRLGELARKTHRAPPQGA